MIRATSSTTATFVALFFAGLLAACNTTSGVGRDVSAVGDAVTESAEDNKGY